MASPGTFLVVQQLMLRVPNAGVLDSTHSRRTRSFRKQLRVYMPQLKILCATTKTQSSHISK